MANNTASATSTRKQGGKVGVNVLAFHANDPRNQRPDGAGPLGVTLAQLRRQFGGDEFLLADPFHGEEHRISLKQWRDADPDNTYVKIEFGWSA